MVGDDPAGEKIASCLVAEGIGSAQLKRCALPTDRSVVIVDDRGENMIVSDVSCARLYDPFAVLGSANGLARGDWVVLQGNLKPETTKKVMSESHSRGCRNVYNASPLGAAETIPPGFVDVLVVNLQEARALSGCDAPADAMRTLFGKGAAAVVVTLGGDGVIFRDREGSGSLPAHPVVAIDTSGAGDVFGGVLVAGLDRGFGLAAAVAWANRSAALATTRQGTLSACPSREELAELISESRTQKEPL
jgi:ribokinase